MLLKTTIENNQVNNDKYQQKLKSLAKISQRELNTEALLAIVHVHLLPFRDNEKTLSDFFS